MNNKINVTNRGTKIIVTIFGILAGLPGIAYGYFEILQGNVNTNGLIIDVVGRNNTFWHGGEIPAFTIIPNYLVSGLLVIIINITIIIWAIFFIGRKHGGIVIILLAIIQMLVGGGFAQFILATIIGIIAYSIHSPLIWWKKHLSTTLRLSLERYWPWIFTVSAILYFCHYAIPFMIGLNNGSLLDMTNPTAGMIFGYLAILPFIFSIITGYASDSLIKEKSIEL